VHFVVGGRLEQIKGADGEIKDENFETGEEELKGLPEDVRICLQSSEKMIFE